MKKFLFVGFFLVHLYIFSQTEEEDAILDSVMDEFFSTDSLLVDLSKTNYLYTNFSFDESVFFAGRDFDIKQFGFTPSISYMRGQNFFVSLGSAYFSELDPKWDFVSISSGYSLFLDRKERMSLTGIYSRIFFADDTAQSKPKQTFGCFGLPQKQFQTAMRYRIPFWRINRFLYFPHQQL